MTTKPLINVPILPSLPHFYKSNTKTLKLLKTPPLSCFRKNGNVNGFSRLPLKMESGGHDNADKSQENFQTSNMEQEMKNNDIWRLFKEAQQNILYLNKQRLWAVEELNRTNREKELLLDKIDQLEAEKQSLDVKDKQSICWELLLRIDSMVLTGLINTGEASDLRNLVLDSKVRVADVFSDILQKNDAELLAEFQHFLNESKKNAYHIIHICTEMEPLVSVGSLASYVTGLCCALQRKGHLVEVILPK